jgi:hypothetical protein
MNLPIMFKFMNQVSATVRQPLCSCIVTLDELNRKRQVELKRMSNNQPAGTLNVEILKIV